jgi:hypothetical protein
VNAQAVRGPRGRGNQGLGHWNRLPATSRGRGLRASRTWRTSRDRSACRSWSASWTRASSWIMWECIPVLLEPINDRISIAIRKPIIDSFRGQGFPVRGPARAREFRGHAGRGRPRARGDRRAKVGPDRDAHRHTCPARSGRGCDTVAAEAFVLHPGGKCPGASSPALTMLSRSWQGGAWFSATPCFVTERLR